MFVLVCDEMFSFSCFYFVGSNGVLPYWVLRIFFMEYIVFILFYLVSCVFRYESNCISVSSVHCYTAEAYCAAPENLYVFQYFNIKY